MIISNFKNFLNESNVTVFCVYTDNRIDSLEFEDFLHKKNFTWPSGSKYILQNSPRINKVLFIKINREIKTFSGYDYETTTDGLIDEIKKTNLTLEYPKDLRKIEILIIGTPTYHPKKIVK